MREHVRMAASRPTPLPPVRRPFATLLPALLLALTFTGCSLGPGDSPPSGVDGLTVPSPAPAPADFEDPGANAWFPLPETDGADEVAGVATTPVSRTVDGETVTDLFATDEDGHVWWFGREGEWEVGPTVPLGLWLPADPRVGDGWRRSAADGVSEERVTVLEVAAPIATAAGEQEAVLLDVRSDLDPTLSRREYYVAGVGEVLPQD